MHFDSHWIGAEQFEYHFSAISEMQMVLLITGDPQRPKQIDHWYL
jgi:hypothetical protein